MRRVFAISWMLAALCLSACGPTGSGDIATEDGDTGFYPLDGMTGNAETTIKTDDGVATIRSGDESAAKLPLGFSLYPGAEISTNAAVDHNGGKGAMVFFTTSDAPPQVVEFYRRQAEAAGIAISLNMSVADGRMLGGEGENGEAFTINASKTDTGTSAQLMVGDKLGT